MNIYDLEVKTRKGEDFKLSSLKGKVSLVVNTATGCGFTPQYEAIEKLYEKYHDKGFKFWIFPAINSAIKLLGRMTRFIILYCEI